MSEVDMETKLKRVLYTFLEPNYKVTDEMYLEKLLTHFSGGNGTSGGAYVPVCEEWLGKLLEAWRDKPLEPALTAFALRIIAIIVSDPHRFNYLEKEAEAMKKIVTVLKLRDTENTNVKLAYVNMLSAIVKHTYGCDYLIKSELWRDVVKYCHQDTSIFVTREGQKFMTEFLNTLFQEDLRTVAEDVLDVALRPLITKYSFKKKEDMKDNIHSNMLLPVLDMSCHIFEASLFGVQTCASYKMLAKFNLESLAWTMLNSTEEKDVVEKISKLLTLVYFTSLECKNKSSEVTSTDFNDFQTKLYNLITLLVTRGLIANCIKVIVQCQFYWHKTSIQVTQDSDKDVKQYVFANQLIILQLMPIMCSIQHTKISENECLDSYCNKLFEVTYESTQRLAYCLRDSVMAQENRPELCHMSVLSLMQIKDIVHRDQAIIVFQALMYNLKDFVPELNHYLHSGEQNSNDFVIQFPELLSSLFEMVTSLIRCFHITWRESVETICLFTILCLLLKNPHLTSKLAVQTLQLMGEVIQNFMPPNLALLVNTLEGSSISQLGPLIHRRMHDTSWEVRDSALEVLQVVSGISEVKFTAFQEHVLENDLCTLCVVVAGNDAESYVRASALSCLGTMVRVHKYWTDSLSTHNLPGKIIASLRSESEGIVRREAAALMKEMYEHHRIPKSMLEEVFVTMAAVAVGDLHWEVQMNALDFWHKAIEHEMSNQGMIDGAFPSVTFSRENRKIVTLTPNEIKNRLGKALQELSKLGCLQVLLKSLEDCNIAVVQKAAKIVTSLSELLSRHGVLAARSTLPDLVSSNCVRSAHNSAEKYTPIFDTFGHEHSKPASPRKSVSNGDVQSRLKVSEQVIESIVWENDMRLLEQVYQNKMSVTDNIKREIYSTIVTPEEFLATLSNLNLPNVLAERTRWLDYCSDDLGSLLDDILASGVGRESNAIDCY